MKSILIIGCGWFGLPLATELTNNEMRVIGTKRSVDAFHTLIDNNITPVELDLAKVIHQEHYGTLSNEYFNTDYLLVNIPPRTRSGNEFYIEELECLTRLLDITFYKKVIFISSTGVYPNIEKTMIETDVTDIEHGNEILFNAEKIFVKYDNAVILRFAGLIGPSRHPGRFFSTENDVTGGNMPVNLVHLSDCINAVQALLNADKSSRVYNLCIPHHPTKQEFYSQAASDINRIAPSFSFSSAAKKQIDGSLITKETAFKYAYRDLYEAMQHC